MGNNEKQWSSATPGLLIILLDQSGSMLAEYNDGKTVDSRTVFASKAVNRVIDTIIQKNFDGKAPKNRCFITVIGYNHNVNKLASGFLKDLDANPVRIETVKQKINDGAGGLLTIDKKMPVWVEPITQDGATNMKGAFEMAKEIIDSWIKDKPENPAPVIINISDGVPYFDGKDVDICMRETVEVVNQIKAIDMEDGKIQVFNAMIGDGSEKTVKFPVSDSELTSSEGKFLFDISTVIPAAYKEAADKVGLSYREGARGAIFQADSVDLIQLINFGSSKGQRDK
jgi:hypothetical protein